MWRNKDKCHIIVCNYKKIDHTEIENSNYEKLLGTKIHSKLNSKGWNYQKGLSKIKCFNAVLHLTRLLLREG